MMKFCRSALWDLIVVIISTERVSAVTVKVEHKSTAVLPCTERCSGVVRWTVFHKSTEPLVECNQTECRSVKEGYQMIHNQYLQGDLSLIIPEADFSKRGWYTCDCDGRDQCDVKLQIENLNSKVQIKSGETLVLSLHKSDQLEVMHHSTGAVNGSSVQICTVIGGSLQCKPEYTNRISLSSSDLELRGTEESDSGVYTVRDNNNKEDLHVYTVTVTGEYVGAQLLIHEKKERPKSDAGVPVRMWVAAPLVSVAVIVISVGVILWVKKRDIKLWFETKSSNTAMNRAGHTHNEDLKNGQSDPSPDQETSPLNNQEQV